MPSTFFFILGTLFLSLNFVRPGGLALSDWLYFAALAAAGLETSQQPRNAKCWWQNRFITPAALVLFGALISSFDVRSSSAAAKEIVQEIYIVTLFVSLTWIMVRRGKMNAIVQAFILSGLFAAAVAGTDAFAGTRFGAMLSGSPETQLWGRYAGSLGHPNKLGYFLVITTTLSLAEWKIANGRHASVLPKIWWPIVVCVQLMGIYLSNSVTAFVGVALAVLLLASAWKPRITRRVGNGVIVFAVLGGLAVVGFAALETAPKGLLDFASNSRSVSDALERVQNVTAFSRLVIFNQALARVYKNPFVGVGFDQVSTSGIGFDLRELPGSIHNTLLQMWYVGGLFAFVGWLVIYTMLAAFAFQVVRGAPQPDVGDLALGVAVAVLAIILMDQFQDAIYQREKWLTFGLMAGYAWDRRWVLKRLSKQAEGKNLGGQLLDDPTRALR